MEELLKKLNQWGYAFCTKPASLNSEGQRERGKNDSSVAKGNSFRRLGSNLSRLIQYGLKRILSNQRVEQGLQIYKSFQLKSLEKFAN